MITATQWVGVWIRMIILSPIYILYALTTVGQSDILFNTMHPNPVVHTCTEKYMYCYTPVQKPF